MVDHGGQFPYSVQLLPSGAPLSTCHDAAGPKLPAAKPTPRAETPALGGRRLALVEMLDEASLVSGMSGEPQVDLHDLS